MSEARLNETLRETGYRASLDPEYLKGRAPAAQRTAGQPAPLSPTYYGLPAIRKPAWVWYIWAYFFAGGIASGAYTTAVITDIRGREEDRPLVRSGHFVALAAASVTPILLIADLGRPRRWYNMFRVFRTRSMVNMGTWILSFMGFFGVAGAVSQLFQIFGPKHRLYRAAIQPLRVFSWLGIIPAGFLGSYTGFLLSATNVPFWAANRLFTALLFFCSSLATGLAATRLAAPLFGPVGPGTEEREREAEGFLLASELAITAASGAATRGFARPLLVGPLAPSYQVGSLGLGVLLPLLVSRRRGSHWSLALAARVLALAGGAVLRRSVVEAGLRSADDPTAYFRYTGSGR